MQRKFVIIQYPDYIPLQKKPGWKSNSSLVNGLDEQGYFVDIDWLKNNTTVNE